MSERELERDLLPPDQGCGGVSTAHSTLEAALPVRLVPASQFTIEELVAAYNQTRVDYIVPMPMNAARLREYIHDYDVVLEMSAVALEDDQILGLAMLGVRPDHAWVTRLGVLPTKRRHGTGQYLMEHLIAQSRRLRVPYVTLDVIKDNMPAEQLFHKLGFRTERELLVIRRPPGSPRVCVCPYTSYALDHSQAVGLLQSRRGTPSWLNETASLVNAGNLAALRIEQEGGAQGWLVYQETALQLGRLVLHTAVGDPYQVGSALLHALHTRHPTLDAKCENLPVDDPHWPAMQETGYLESFRRVEMHLQLDPFA